MKPIFEEERQFLNNILKIELPTECWRDSSKIYLDCTCKKPLYQFKVEDNIPFLTKDNTKLFDGEGGYKQKKIQQLQELYFEEINTLKEKTQKFFHKYMFEMNHINDDKYVIGYSGGKDSSVLLEQWVLFLIDLFNNDKESYNKIKDKWEVNFANTSNDTSNTYKMVKNIPNLIEEYLGEYDKEKLKIMNPEEGWSTWLKRKNYFIPTSLTRNCCSTYKEGQLNKFYDKKQTITHFTGVRKYESVKRKDYEYVMDYEQSKKIFGSSNFPKQWVKACPIVEWRDEHIWLYILREKIEFNNMYNVGFQRVGCLLCPYQSNYNDLLIQKYYPKRWDWWMDVIKKNYEITSVDKRLHWTLDEFKFGKWKDGKGKVQVIISKKFTKERCLEVSKILGIDFDMAKKYWNRECECGKKLNATELAMFYKLYGRFEGVEDNRKPKCKKCVCEDMNITPKEYLNKYIEFRDGGCNLF